MFLFGWFSPKDFVLYLYFEHRKDEETPMKMKIMSSMALSSFYGRRIADSSPSARKFELRKDDEMITKITITLPFTFPYLIG